MLISKFDLYKPEWLELVFDNRNKDYGAYDLRQHYARNMVRAMGITFLGIAVLFGAGVILKTTPVPVTSVPNTPPIVVTITPHVDPVLPKPIKVEPPRTTAPPKTNQFIPFVVKPDPEIKTPPTPNAQITGAIGQTTIPGEAVDPGIDEPANGTGTQPVPPNNTVYPSSGVDVMPEPVGGDAAWSKFLSKNLRFPPPAREDGASGRVILSFIIEKDGHLSNISVERPAGHGFDEEATRVLKLAKAWKPGMQNGQPVRVKYFIPINFQLTEN
jgi:protein TonB